MKELLNLPHQDNLSSLNQEVLQSQENLRTLLHELTKKIYRPKDENLKHLKPQWLKIINTQPIQINQVNQYLITYEKKIICNQSGSWEIKNIYLDGGNERLYNDRLSQLPGFSKQDIPTRYQMRNENTQEKSYDTRGYQYNTNFIVDGNALNQKYKNKINQYTDQYTYTKFGLHKYLYNRSDGKQRENGNYSNVYKIEKTIIYAGIKKEKTNLEIFTDIRTVQKKFSENNSLFLNPMYLVDFGEIIYANLPKKNERKGRKFALQNPSTKGYTESISKNIDIKQFIQQIHPTSALYSRFYSDTLKTLLNELDLNKLQAKLNNNDPEKITEIIISEVYNHIQSCY